MGSPLAYRDFGLRKLGALLRGLGLERRLGPSQRLFSLLAGTLRGVPHGGLPPWPSSMTAEGTPFELGVTFGSGEPSIRVLGEARLAPFDLASNWKTGCALTRVLSELRGVTSERFQHVSAAFAPTRRSCAPMALWHAGHVEPDGTLSFDVLLNAQSRGARLAPTLVREALVRLGLDYAWDELSPKLTPTSELRHLALELSPRADARVTVSVSHPHATAAEVDAVVRDDSGYVPRLAQSWIEELTDTSGPLSARPIVTSHTFRSPHDAAEVSVQIPTRDYAASDADTLRRAQHVLGSRVTRLRAGVEAMAEAPLDDAFGIVSSMTLTPAADGIHVTAHLAAEAPVSALAPRSYVAELFPGKHRAVTGLA
jgi:hypothetical protein